MHAAVRLASLPTRVPNIFTALYVTHYYRIWKDDRIAGMHCWQLSFVSSEINRRAPNDHLVGRKEESTQKDKQEIG